MGMHNVRVTVLTKIDVQECVDVGICVSVEVCMQFNMFVCVCSYFLCSLVPLQVYSTVRAAVCVFPGVNKCLLGA